MPIDLIALSAALLAGLVGSVHCVAMCGGIATGFSPYGASQKAAWQSALITNAGRVLGYTLAGALVGGFGHGLVAMFRLEGLMFALRAMAGLILILVAFRMLGLKSGFNPLGKMGEMMWAWLRPVQTRLLPADTLVKRVALGMLWGWLPCGLSSTMLAAAWLQASALGGALMMLAFGLGTLPTMLPLSYSGSRWLANPKYRRLAGIVMLCAGVLTVSAPWLMNIPALHQVLAALGCLPSA